MLWAGSDDGLVHVSRDGGKNWKNVTPPDLPEWMHDQQHRGAPVREGRPLRRRRRATSSTTSGPTSTGPPTTARPGRRSTTGIDADHFTRVVRADPKRPRPALRRHRARHVRLVRRRRRAGSRCSSTCRSCRSPTWPCEDDDLIAATQGRGFWILDDLRQLRQLPDDLGEVAAPVRARAGAPPPGRRLPGGNAAARNLGTNPPAGAVVYYFLDKAPSARRRRRRSSRSSTATAR